MLSIEYIDKRVRFFRIELSLIVLACFVAFLFFWQLLSMLRIVKWSPQLQLASDGKLMLVIKSLAGQLPADAVLANTGASIVGF